MPELPGAETIARVLNRALKKRTERISKLKVKARNGNKCQQEC